MASPTFYGNLPSLLQTRAFSLPNQLDPTQKFAFDEAGLPGTGVTSSQFDWSPYVEGLDLSAANQMNNSLGLSNQILERLYAEHPEYFEGAFLDAGGQPYASTEDWIERNRNLPGHAGVSREGKIMRAGTLAALAAIGGGAAGAAMGGTTGATTAGTTGAEAAGAYGGFDAAAVSGAEYGAGAAGAAGAAPIISNFAPTTAPTNPMTGALLQGAGGAATSTALSRILANNGTATAADYLSVLGSAAPAVLGAYASNKQSQSFEDLANRYMDMGAPSRARYEGSFAPGFTMANEPGYTDALDQTTKSTLHGMSAKFGNPADSPNAWTQTLKDVNASFAYPALMDYRKLNANAGGLSRFAEAAPGAASNAITAQKGVYDAIGAGAADIFNPPRRVTFQDLMRMYA